MSKIPPIIPVSDLRKDAAAVLQRVKTSDQPLIITQRGRAAAVLISMESYEKAENDRKLLQLLAQGDREIAAGEGHSLDSVLAEADRLLEDD